MPKYHINSSLLLNLKYPAVVLLSGGLVAWDQIRRVKRKIELSTTPKVWQRPVLAPEYIYINDNKTEDFLQKFEIAGLTNELYKMIQLYLWFTGKWKGSQLYEDVFSIHQNLAWKLLRLAQDTNYYFRQRAVHELAHMPGLSDATCCQIAQASDDRTAVGLARTEGVELRLLRDPSGWRRPLDRKALLGRLHKLLLDLDAECPHPCLQYVIAETFAETDEKGFDDDVGFNKSRPDAISKSLEAILHHSWLGTNAASIVTNNGLGVLVDLYREVHDNEQHLPCLIMLSRILSNVSMQHQFLNQLHASGCIKVLARLLQHADLRVRIPAGRALLNCDLDTCVPGTDPVRLLRNVYVLHPVHRSPKPMPVAADVVFVHGLLGGVFVTWRQRDEPRGTARLSSQGDGDEKDASNVPLDNKNVPDLPIDSNVDVAAIVSQLGALERQDWETKRTQCWPCDWLPRDVPQLRVLGVNYDTNLTMWAPMCPIASNRLTLSDRSNHLISVLEQAGLGKRPIVWVAHSMGGLIVKDLLVKCSESSDGSTRSLADETVGVVFFSTPHRGSRLATINPTSRILVWPTIEVQELTLNSPALLRLNEKFVDFASSRGIPVVSFSERLSTYVRGLHVQWRFVDDDSSSLPLGELYGVPLDHLSVCKPASRDSFLYRRVVGFIQEVIADAKRQGKRYK